MYNLSYHDLDLQQDINIKIDARTERIAMNRANKLMKGKRFTNPKLEVEHEH